MKLADLDGLLFLVMKLADLGRAIVFSNEAG